MLAYLANRRVGDGSDQILVTEQTPADKPDVDFRSYGDGILNPSRLCHRNPAERFVRLVLCRRKSLPKLSSLPSRGADGGAPHIEFGLRGPQQQAAAVYVWFNQQM